MRHTIRRSLIAVLFLGMAAPAAAQVATHALDFAHLADFRWRSIGTLSPVIRE